MELVSAQTRKVLTTEITMPCRLGLHARVATRFIYFAQRFRSAVRVIKGDLVVDGKSVLGLLVLGASRNSKLRIEVCGEDAERAIQSIETYFQMLENCLDESE